MNFSNSKIHSSKERYWNQGLHCVLFSASLCRLQLMWLTTDWTGYKMIIKNIFQKYFPLATERNHAKSSSVIMLIPNFPLDSEMKAKVSFFCGSENFSATETLRCIFQIIFSYIVFPFITLVFTYICRVAVYLSMKYYF